MKPCAIYARYSSELQRATSLEARMIEEERRHQDELRHSHELLLRVIDAVPVRVSATDRNGRFVFANDCFARAMNRLPSD